MPLHPLDGVPHIGTPERNAVPSNSPPTPMAQLRSRAEIAKTIERERHVEILPGTEIMTDIGGVHFVHANNAANATVLVPQPTSDIHDPLNWSRKWKFAVIFTQGFFVLFTNITALSIAPLTPIYVAQFQTTLPRVALLTGACIIALGYANFVIIPCANVFGRRPVMIGCSFIILASDIWQATAKNYNSFIGARAFNGIGTAANESIMTIVVADIFFLHQRGAYVGLYFWCYFGGVMVGPIISGSIAAHVTWRWFFWVCTIATAISLAMIVFMFPETRRMHRDDETTTISELTEEKPEGGKPNLSESWTQSPSPEAALPMDQNLGRGRPSRAQYNLIQPIDRYALSTILRHIVTPVELFFYPIVFWAAMTMGAAANALLDVNLTQSQVFAAPPYNFSPANVGFANFALLVGAILGLLVAGPFSDWVAMRATKKNGGIREPEMRLPALIPFIIAAVVGMTVCGVGYQNQWPWQAIIVVGFGLVGMISVAIPTISITYAIDCYKPIAGQIMVVATVAKNTFGFGMTYFINDWAVKDGFIPPLMLLMAMTVGFALVGGVLLYFFGKTMRRWSRNAKVHSF